MISAESDVLRHCFSSLQPARLCLLFKHAAQLMLHIPLTQKLHLLPQHQQKMLTG